MRVIDIDTAELRTIIEDVVRQVLNERKEEKAEYVYGLDGLAKLLGCSKQSAMRAKNSGKFAKAIKQDGRKIIINKTKLMELL